jgi:hypothetical protein
MESTGGFVGLLQGTKVTDAQNGQTLVWNGNLWVNSDGGFIVDPMTDEGDMIYLFGGDPTALHVGSENKMLAVKSGYPSWQTNAYYPDPMTLDGDMLVEIGGVPTRLAKGAPGSFLNMESSTPTWNMLNLATTFSGNGCTTILDLTDIIAPSSFDASNSMAYNSKGLVTSKSNLLTTRGDMLIMNSVPAAARLGIGSNGTMMGSNGSDPSWALASVNSTYYTGNLVSSQLTPTDSGITAGVKDGSQTVTFDAKGRGTASAPLLTSRGDLLTMNSVPSAVRLGLGSNGTMLGSNGSDPSWALASVNSTYYTGNLVSSQLTPTDSGITAGTKNGAQTVTFDVKGRATGSASLLTTRGDLLTMDATPTAVRLALGTANKFFTTDGTDPSWNAISTDATITGNGIGTALSVPLLVGPSTTIMSSGWFGNATADQTFSINTSLTDDLYVRDLGVNNGVTLDTNGFRVMCSRTATINGTVACKGNNGATGAGGLGAAGGTQRTAGTIGVTGGGGGAGGNPGVGGTAGATVAGPALGGAGGAGGTIAGGGGGTTGPTAAQGNIGIFKTLQFASTGRTITNVAIGCGGGGGGGGGMAGGGGGGGGSGGGALFFSAKVLTGSGSINCNGGNGGNGQSGGTNSSGGGGGGGGWVAVAYRDASGWSGTITATKGTFGLGFGTGTNGVAGADGSVYIHTGVI